MRRAAGAVSGRNPYPGKAVVEQGMTLIGGILDRRGDNVAMLEAFTRAEDELLDWKEDFAEVDFFFKNQAGVFRDAVRLSEQAERDSHYFADEPQAVEAAKAIRAIIQMQRPYREVRRLPELKAAVQQAYARISDARAAPAWRNRRSGARRRAYPRRGRAGLRGDIRKIDEQLEAFKGARAGSGKPRRAGRDHHPDFHLSRRPVQAAGAAWRGCTGRTPRACASRPSAATTCCRRSG